MKPRVLTDFLPEEELLRLSKRFLRVFLENGKPQEQAPGEIENTCCGLRESRSSPSGGGEAQGFDGPGGKVYRSFADSAVASDDRCAAIVSSRLQWTRKLTPNTTVGPSTTLMSQRQAGYGGVWIKLPGWNIS